MDEMMPGICFEIIHGWEERVGVGWNRMAING